MNDNVKIIECPKDVNELRGYDPSVTIVIINSNDTEVLTREALHIAEFYYIIDNKDDEDVSDLLNKMAEGITEDPIHNYKIMKRNQKHLTAMKNADIPTTIVALEKLLVSIRDMDKKTFIDITKYSLDDLIAVTEQLKDLMSIEIEDHSCVIKYNNCLKKLNELQKEVSNLTIECKSLEKKNEELVIVPELKQRLAEVEDTNKELYIKINSLESELASRKLGSEFSMEIAELKAEKETLNARIRELDSMNAEYESRLNNNIQESSDVKDKMITALQNELNKLNNSNSTTGVNIKEILPLATPESLPLPNLRYMLYIKEADPINYLYEMISFFKAATDFTRRFSLKILTLIYHNVNEFEDTLYNAEYSFDNKTSGTTITSDPNIKIVNDISLSYLKSIDIQTYNCIIIIDKLGYKKDIFEGYKGLEKFYTINNMENVSIYKLKKKDCLHFCIPPVVDASNKDNKHKWVTLNDKTPNLYIPDPKEEGYFIYNEMLEANKSTALEGKLYGKCHKLRMLQLQQNRFFGDVMKKIASCGGGI